MEAVFYNGSILRNSFINTKRYEKEKIHKSD